jgi:tripartite-type tricarboxylate transporter receptor subunit TctC
MKSVVARLGALFLISMMAGPAVGQGQGQGHAYPAKPIRIVVGFPPGGGNDIMARMVGAKLQEAWGQSVVIDNKPGANAIIATEFVARSPADGYTLLVNANGPMTLNPALYAKLPYDPLKDFAPISTIAMFPIVLVLHPSVPAGTVRELIAYARANPGKLNAASGSSGFQVAIEMFKQMTGTDINVVNYKGTAQSVNAVLAGDVHLSMVDSPPAMPHIKAGKMRGLGVTTAKRVGSLPDLPTLSEAGVAGYDMVLWISLFAPAGTPREVVDKLNAEVVRIVKMPDIQARLAGMGLEPVGNSAEQVAEWLRAETARLGPVVKAANMRAD